MPENTTRALTTSTKRVSPQEARELRGVLLDALTRSSEPLFVGPIIDALGCACDASLKQLYVQHLARYLRELKLANKVVYAALRALAEINEPVFGEGQGRSLADVDRNIREAQRYLEKHAIPIPW